MSRIAYRLASVAAAALCTLVMLAGIDQLAVSSPASAVLAHATAIGRA